MKSIYRKFVFIAIILISQFVLVLSADNVLVVRKFDSFNEEVLIDKEFEYFARIIDHEAKKQNLQIMVQESFRVNGRAVNNAIVIPYEKSNHFIGHAIDINIVYKGIWYNSTKLKKYDELPIGIKNFIIGCKSKGISWGGDYRINDAVHFDDNLNNIDPVKYEWLYNLHQG